MEEENKTNEKNEKEVSGKANVIEVESAKFVIGGKVFTITERRDINAIVGEELSKAETKQKLITAIRENGEEEEKKEEEKGEKSKFKAKYLLPIVSLLMIPVMAISCNKVVENDEERIELKTVPIDTIVYDIENPSILSHGIVAEYGQEGMTAGGIEGNAFNSNYYSWQEQAEAESKTSTGVNQFETMKIEVEENMKILTDESSTQEQRYEASKRILEIQKEAEEMYNNNVSMTEEYAERFKETSEAYRDSNTDNEKVIIDLMRENYMNELGLASHNVSQIQEIVALCDQGYELKLEVQREKDGDYQITGEALKEVVVKEDLGKSKSLWQKFTDFVRGRSDKGIEK